MTIICFISCTKKDSGTAAPIVKPTDLVISADISTDGSGNVNFTATAKNAVRYSYTFGISYGETAIISANGSTSYKYSTTGSYTVHVIAYGADNSYAFADKTISVNVAFVIPTTGYTTPLTYPGRTLVWDDEFSGTTLNSAFWTQETGNVWANNELQNYQASNTEVKDGYLTITAKKETVNGRDYTSSRINSQNKMKFTYGRVDIRALLPKSQGIWPALWMLGNNKSSTNPWPKCGEIDLMELIGGTASPKSDSKIYSTLHWDDNGHQQSQGSYTLSSGKFSDQFHVYSMEWNATTIIMYLDDVEFKRFNITPATEEEFRKDFFFTFNVAVGGNWPGNPDSTTIFPQRMVVDYVRVFQ
ncbi:glycoside hydrolase family 16 protein [Pedobacter sp. SD-b]|uniref:Glycoside hydrolase family 16 protein n=1 Tax=Pedobacter segetis TaxID=2793069 RepID=A0ABS1BN03_9SPHI|nr:family 16 glycosylhydrolase [Pedobacter segetis]MBK0384147.1 glycoside hydrolase family 16 protein [Pedobacter segetis]